MQVKIFNVFFGVDLVRGGLPRDYEHLFLHNELALNLDLFYLSYPLFDLFQFWKPGQARSLPDVLLVLLVGRGELLGVTANIEAGHPGRPEGVFYIRGRASVLLLQLVRSHQLLEFIAGARLG